MQEAASANGFPAARQTIYAYERGGLTPSLKQFLELVEFYAVHPIAGDGAKPEATCVRRRWPRSAGR